RHRDRVPGPPYGAGTVRPVRGWAAAALRSLRRVADPELRGIPDRDRRVHPRGVAGVSRPRAVDGGRARFCPVEDGPQLQLRLHPVLLRSAGTQGSIRLGAAEPTPRDRSREGVSVTPQAADPDSLRAALRAVFAAREYRWSEPSSTWSWLLTQWHRVLDWL